MWGYPEFYIPVPGGYDNWVTPPWERGVRAPAPARAHHEDPGGRMTPIEDV